MFYQEEEGNTAEEPENQWPAWQEEIRSQVEF